MADQNAEQDAEHSVSAQPGVAQAQRQFVTFSAGDQLFAVDMAPVQEIIRVPAMVKVPLSPPALEGVANLRGRVLPIVSLRRVLGFADLAADDNARAVVVDLGQPIGFVVDRVASVIGVDAASIEDVAHMSGTINTELLSGMIKAEGARPMVMVLNFEKLIAREFALFGGAGSARAAAVLAPGSAAGEAALEQMLHLVSFNVGGQEYAIAIEQVQEIVQMPELLVQVPHVAPHVLGVMTLREQILPLVGLRRMFGMASVPNEGGRIVVVGLAGVTVGIVVDSVNAVLRVPLQQVEALPALLAGDDALREITDICQLDGGKRLVSVLSVDKLFRHASVRAALNALDGAAGEGALPAETGAALASGDDEQLVVFRLDQQEFGVPIGCVQEIVRVPAMLTQVPKAPPAVEGVINLRGAVLPVFDLRRRLDLARVARHEGQRIVVFMLRGVRSGFIVDAVAEVLRVPAQAIAAAPQLSSDQAQLLARMANLPLQGRLLQLLEPDFLLDDVELAGVAGMAQGAGALDEVQAA